MQDIPLHLMLRSIKKVQGRYKLMYEIGSSGRSDIKRMARSTTALRTLSMSSGSSHACITSCYTKNYESFSEHVLVRDCCIHKAHTGRCVCCLKSSAHIGGPQLMRKT